MAELQNEFDSAKNGARHARCEPKSANTVHLTIFDFYPESLPFFHVSFVLVASEKEHWSEMANQRPRQQVSQPAEEPKCGPEQ